MKTFQLICLLVVVMSPALKTGVSIGKDLQKGEDKTVLILTAIVVLSIEYAIMGFAGIFTLFNK